MPRIWLDLFRRLAFAAGLLLVTNLAVMAFWSPAWFAYWQVPISCTIFICFLGATLFDSLFRERPR